jgi:hypothetical protein
MEAERERERELMDNLFSSFETSFFFFLVFFHITGVRSQNKIISFGGLKRQYYYYFFYFFFIYVGVRVSLRAPRLISRPTEHPANPVDM